MNHFLASYKWVLVGIALGGIGGYGYYFFVGCASGNCAITSSPVISTLYGMLMGGLFMNLFSGKKAAKTNQNSDKHAGLDKNE